MADETVSLDTKPPGSALERTTPTTPPPAPNPSTDPNLTAQARTPPPLHHAAPTSSSHDLFKIAPIQALKLLSAGVEALVHVTGDIPPTPPPVTPTIPHMRGFQQEKAAIARSHSEKELARLAERAAAEEPRPFLTPQVNDAPHATSSRSQQPIDGVRLRHPPIPSPPFSTPEPYIIVGENSQPLNLQHSAITRKFYSKAPPPISIEDYLLRIHRFCPMSTAVYLATSLYIFRLAVEERAIPVTRRNCHRLLLAGLRVAMKALEDLCYPHAKIARVGGVSEIELARLEISFCFLAGFDLVVTEESLKKHWETLSEGKGLTASAQTAGLGEVGRVPVLRLEHRKKISTETAGAVG